MKSRVAHFANLDVRSSIDLKIKVTKIKLQILRKTAQDCTADCSRIFSSLVVHFGIGFPIGSET